MLPRGITYKHNISDIERSHGWNQVKEPPDINKPEDSNGVIRNPNAIEDDGRFQRVIGDNPGGPGQIELWLLEGVVLSASAYENIEDPLGREINIHRDEEHALRENKDITREQLKEAVRNPDEIWQGSVLDYYAKQLDDGTWRIIKVWTVGGANRVSTVVREGLTSKQDVDEYLRNLRELVRRIY